MNKHKKPHAEANGEYDALPFQDQCEVARKAEVGSEWISRKSGISAFVKGHSQKGVALRRDKGPETTKQYHYFAYDYFPKTRSPKRRG